MALKNIFVIAGLSLVILGTGAVAGLDGLEPPKVAVSAPVAEAVIEVYGLGSVEARLRSEMGFAISGILADIPIEAGAFVSKGQVLARLDDREQRARLAQAQASVAQAQAELAQARAGVDKATANRNQKAGSTRRKQDLADKGFTSAEALDDARSALQGAKAELTESSSAVAVAEANLAHARATEDREQAVLDQHVLTAPYDAVVVARLRGTGGAVKASEPVHVLADPAGIWVEAFVDEARAGSLEAGQTVAIRLRSRPRQTLPGTVARIGVENDRISQERRVWVAFDSPLRPFHLGEQAEIAITAQRLADTHLVPPNAVTDLRHGTGTVWLVSRGRVERRALRFGPAGLDGRLPVLDVLPAGAAVVVGGGEGLSDGVKVSPSL